MPKQKVMDHTGHTEHVFDKANEVSVAEAMERFDELVGRGFTPAVLAGDGNREVVRSFDPEHEDVLFIPRMVGG